MKTINFAVALAALSVFGASFAQAPTGKNPLEGKKLPAFSMKDLSGKAVTNSSIKGKVVLFDFWATWCGPCMKASPLMQSLHKKYASKGLVVIGAKVLDEEGSASEYAKKHGYTYRFTTGGEELMSSFGFKGIPAFVIVDKKGVVSRVQTGYAPTLDGQFEAKVKQLLAAK
jgi:thiol-disulfide isomerase/thioredoxin